MTQQPHPQEKCKQHPQEHLYANANPTLIHSHLKLEILKEINPEYSSEELLLKLKLQYFGHLMWRAGKDPDAGRDWGQEEKGKTEDEMVGWHHRLDDDAWWAGSGNGGGRRSLCSAVHGVTKSRTQQSNWTTPKTGNKGSALQLASGQYSVSVAL